MFRSLSIKNFRCFKDFKIEGLERVNLIGGANDVGKTCLLEAIFLLIGESNAFLLQRLNTHRGLRNSDLDDPDEIANWVWASYFHEYLIDRTIEIDGIVGSRTSRRLRLKVIPSAVAALALRPQENGAGSGSTNGHASKTLQADYSSSAPKQQRTAHLTIHRKEIEVQPPPPPPEVAGWFLAARGAPPVEEDAKLLDKLEVAKKTFDLIEPLQVLEPRLKALRTITGVGGTLIFGDVGLARLVPLGILGDGVNRFMSILLRIASAPKGVVLIDEIDSGFHYSKLEQVWEAIASAAVLFDVQIFATTHSFECIRTAHQAFKMQDHYGFRYFRLERQDGAVAAKGLDEETLDVVQHSDLEIR
jgi:hypothetical protein